MQPEQNLKQTPLYAEHVALGARIVPFAGFEMPVHYSGIVDEHLAVRRTCGMFDVSHMGEIRVSGPAAAAFVQHVVTNDVGRLYDGRAMYTVMCNTEGGIIDDLLVYRFSAEQFMLVVNAANVAKDLHWLLDHQRTGATIEDVSDLTALIALQGPASFDVLGRVARNLSLATLKYYHFVRPAAQDFLGCTDAVISRTGYTGEIGVEIYCERDRARDVWSALLETGRDAGLQPAGLGARDTLRLEAGFALYGNDLDERTNPLEAGLEWIVRLDKPEFVGKEALVRVTERGLERRLVGFLLEERGVPRSGYPISANGRAVGTVTSGTHSPILNRGIGMGYVENRPNLTEEGASVSIGIREKEARARIKRPPFHKK